MSNRSTSKANEIQSEPLSVQKESTALLKSSPLFGWLYAGGDLVAAKLDEAAGIVSKALDDTHETLNAMQTKGAEVESELKRTLNPATLIDNVQKLVTANPLFSVFSGGQKRIQKEQQLALLSAKVDLLVEQVALLAAKQAAVKAAKAPKASSQTVSKTAAKTASNNKTESAAKTASTSKTTASKGKGTRSSATSKSKSATSKRSTPQATPSTQRSRSTKNQTKTAGSTSAATQTSTRQKRATTPKPTGTDESNE